ncbi:hypothetical protein [Vulgatibacter sp.]|uniref:hypothetical protein n=1 Tax=Vulgatibacter sp. TaxID=1971226 RepID=UPI0035674A54
MSRLSVLLGLIFALVGVLPVACGDDGGDSNSGGSGGGGGGCTETADCSDGQVCSPLGTCVQCATDGDCGRAQRCDAASYSCLFRDGWGDECEAHETCPLGMFCTQGLCVPGEVAVRCGALGQCPEGQRCNRALNVCEEDLGCFDNADCLEEEVCNPGTGSCEQRCTPETEIDVCQAREECIEGRCVECTEDVDCGPGLVCNIAAGRCAGANTCFSDRDCEAGTICNRATSTCTEPPPPCDANDDCLEDERCDLQLGRCVLAACQPDLDEPNDDQANATPISAGHRENLTVCGAEEDWYRFTLQRGDRINVNIDADPLASGGLDVQLRDAAGRELDRNPFLVDATVSADGDYFLRVRTQDKQTRYALHSIVVRGVPCDDDSFEENDDSTQASPLTTGTRSNLQACPGDPDWYVVEVPSGSGLSVRLTHDPLKGDLDLILFGSDGTTQLASSRTTDQVEQVAVAGVSGGRAYVLVIPSNDRTQNAYDLSITAQ